jgi:hypothetical protein
MAENYLKCPNCGTGNDDNAKFCQACRWALGPAYAQRPTQVPTATRSIPIWVIVLIVVLILAGAGIGAVYSMPRSKIKVIVSHSEYSSIGVNVYIDGVLKSSTGVSPGTSILGVRSVVAGTHTVQIDCGGWYTQVITHWFSPDETVHNYVAPDGKVDITYAYEVGPLYTKNVYFALS